MSKKLGVYFLLLTFLGQSLLANAFPILPQTGNPSVFTVFPTSTPAANLNNKSPCHEETANLSKLIDTNLYTDSDTLTKHGHCEKNCHCSSSLHFGLYSAVLFKGFESYDYSGHPQFIANYLSSFPTKMPSSLLRPPSLFL